MKKLITIAIGLFLGLQTALHAVIITYRIEVDSIYLPGHNNLNRDNYSSGGMDVRVYGSSVSSLASLDAEFEALVSGVLSGDAVAAFNTFIEGAHFKGPDDSPQWGEIPVSPGIGPAVSFDWQGQVEGLVPGDFPVMLVTSQPLGSLGESDFVGLVFSDYAVLPIGNAIVGFNSGSPDARWSEWLIGSPGSLTLTPITAIPEPKIYGLVLGLLCLIVGYRR